MKAKGTGQARRHFGCPAGNELEAPSPERCSGPSCSVLDCSEGNVIVTRKGDKPGLIMDTDTQGGASTSALGRDRSGRMLSRQQDEPQCTYGPPVIDEPLEPNKWGKLKEI